jgi:DNA primase
VTEANGVAELRIEYKPVGNNGSATLTAKLADDVIGHAKIDLGKPKARTEFVEALVKGKPGIDGAAMEKELLRIGAELSARHAKGDEKPAPPEADALLLKMPQHVRHVARAMLESPDLMQRVIDDVASCGVAGERELVATIYLVGVSRLLPRPLASIVQAPSSTGKSYVVEKTAALFPPETVIHTTAMTAQSLYYLEAGALQHKFIVAGERSRKEDDDTAEATRALREMIGSGRLTKLVPMKEGGRIVTQRIEQPGPIAYVETTTLTKIFDEDANRCLLLSADERKQQTAHIVNRLAGHYSGAAANTVDVIVQRHHAAQRMIQERPVVIPFAEQIAERFDCERVEARRAFPHLMSMIQASSLLHQFQRRIDGDGRIVASVDDYQLARRLVRGPLARLLGGQISDAAIRFYDRLVEWEKDKFTTAEVYRHDRKSEQAIRGWLRDLAGVGAVEQIEANKGSRPAIWKLTGIDRDDLVAGDCGLPAVEEITT